MRAVEPVLPNDDFAAVRRRFELPLLQYAARILGDHERARDVVQETFIECNATGARKPTPHLRNGFSPSAVIAPSTFAGRKNA